jgi:hypothetical protein
MLFCSIIPQDIDYDVFASKILESVDRYDLVGQLDLFLEFNKIANNPTWYAENILSISVCNVECSERFKKFVYFIGLYNFSCSHHIYSQKSIDFYQENALAAIYIDYVKLHGQLISTEEFDESFRQWRGCDFLVAALMRLASTCMKQLVAMAPHKDYEPVMFRNTLLDKINSNLFFYKDKIVFLVQLEIMEQGLAQLQEQEHPTVNDLKLLLKKAKWKGKGCFFYEAFAVYFAFYFNCFYSKDFISLIELYEIDRAMVHKIDNQNMSVLIDAYTIYYKKILSSLEWTVKAVIEMLSQ